MSEKLKVPKHIGIIPDGNRRWARKRHLPAIEGHRQGYRTARNIASRAMDMGVDYVSIYGFSTENWKRPPEEVTALMGLLEWITAKKEIRSIDREDIRVRFAGREQGLDSSIVEALRDAEERTKDNQKGQLVMCINYGGRAEITDAMKAIAEEGIAPEDINEDTIANHLYLPDVPPADMVIRSGEQRTSNFLPWQAAYAELMFSDKLWPDFTNDDLEGFIEDFSIRQRRFGE